MLDLPHVALIIETSKAFGRGLLRGIGRYLRRHRPWATWIEEKSLDDPLPRWLKGWKGDGIIARTRTRRTMQQVADFGIPIVQLGEEYIEELPAVDIDHSSNGALGAKHLIERHFQHFAFIGLRGVGWSVARREAFSERVRQVGCQCHVYESASRAPFVGDWERERKTLTAWISALPRPVGVMASYDVIGRSVLNICREVGIAVPEEIAVLGVDNDEVLCEVADPPLSSVDQGQDSAGYEAAAMLDRILRGEDSNFPIILEPRGVVTRLSTDTMAISDHDVATALSFIRSNACGGIKVDDVAEGSPLTRRTLERRFQQLLGRTVNEEILRVRVGRVMQLLEDTDWSLDQIAEVSGFKRASYLSVAFTRETGRTPGDYRRECGKESRGRG